jgi:hypothetical protein
MLSEEAPLVRTAINAVRELRYDRKADPRVATVVSSAVVAPTLVGTFVVAVRARDGGLVEELVAFGCTESGEAFNADHLIAASDAPEPARLAALARATFSDWWEVAQERLGALALARTEALSKRVAGERAEQARRARQQLGDWFAAECRVAREAAGIGGLALLGDEPLAVRRKISMLEAEHVRQRDALDAYADVSPVAPDGLGALLVMPA